ncbi:hypothetical protein EGE62_22700 [Salmonella enterica]|uniref:Uncharacterized protein n=1 Tax=Halomonas colorata TaxID=2742615 RepID=A0ABR9G379_9GAMM|nr:MULTISPECIES: hypothetical protein [Halomonas]EAQ2882453.1 hypothetical protein [Salmonella enterica]MBE0465367.1 hypothetical protein [Halomonas colorata]
MNRKACGKAINVFSSVGGLVVAWQAIRFAMGDIGNVTIPVFEWLANTTQPQGSVTPADATGLLSMTNFMQSIIWWIMGFSVWLIAATVVSGLGNVAARIATVGWQQYLTEQREAHEAARIAAERQALKDRRRELRRKVLEAREPRRGSSGILPFVLGVLFGSFFL